MDYSYKKVKENIKENSFVIKKKFGQNFIIDNNIINNIVNSAAIDSDTLVIEVGPGMGALTNELVIIIFQSKPSSILSIRFCGVG